MPGEMFDQIIPMSWHGQPEPVPRAVMFLASDNSSYAVGLTVMVDGGMMDWTDGHGSAGSGTVSVFRFPVTTQYLIACKLNTRGARCASYGNEPQWFQWRTPDYEPGGQGAFLLIAIRDRR
ncbi:SDR family oxidoreductase [Pseudolabrys sp. FHR47]|uniref:SDR family oxidoreductase n=1 Tax=Pseudolabrys sp. FHR47 TaxID=2562284 RepID=UPI0010BE8819